MENQTYEEYQTHEEKQQHEINNYRGTPWWLSRLRIWHCHLCGSGHCCGTGSPQPGKFFMHRCSQNLKIKRKVLLSQRLCLMFIECLPCARKCHHFACIKSLNLYNSISQGGNKGLKRHAFSLYWKKIPAWKKFGERKKREKPCNCLSFYPSFRTFSFS